jgi:hypothetical protein
MSKYGGALEDTHNLGFRAFQCTTTVVVIWCQRVNLVFIICDLKVRVLAAFMDKQATLSRSEVEMGHTGVSVATCVFFIKHFVKNAEAFVCLFIV